MRQSSLEGKPSSSRLGIKHSPLTWIMLLGVLISLSMIFLLGSSDGLELVRSPAESGLVLIAGYNPMHVFVIVAALTSAFVIIVAGWLSIMDARRARVYQTLHEELEAGKDPVQIVESLLDRERRKWEKTTGLPKHVEFNAPEQEQNEDEVAALKQPPEQQQQQQQQEKQKQQQQKQQRRPQSLPGAMPSLSARSTAAPAAAPAAEAAAGPVRDNVLELERRKWGAATDAEFADVADVYPAAAGLPFPAQEDPGNLLQRERLKRMEAGTPALAETGAPASATTSGDGSGGRRRSKRDARRALARAAATGRQTDGSPVLAAALVYGACRLQAAATASGDTAPAKGVDATAAAAIEHEAGAVGAGAAGALVDSASLLVDPEQRQWWASVGRTSGAGARALPDETWWRQSRPQARRLQSRPGAPPDETWRRRFVGRAASEDDGRAGFVFHGDHGRYDFGARGAVRDISQHLRAPHDFKGLRLMIHGGAQNKTVTRAAAHAAGSAFEAQGMGTETHLLCLHILRICCPSSRDSGCLSQSRPYGLYRFFASKRAVEPRKLRLARTAETMTSLRSVWSSELA